MFYPEKILDKQYICCFSLQTAFLETNPYLLGMTIVVSIVHSVFEFLAFKNGKFNHLLI